MASAAPTAAVIRSGGSLVTRGKTAQSQLAARKCSCDVAVSESTAIFAPCIAASLEVVADTGAKAAMSSEPAKLPDWLKHISPVFSWPDSVISQPAPVHGPRAPDAYRSDLLRYRCIEEYI